MISPPTTKKPGEGKLLLYKSKPGKGRSELRKGVKRKCIDSLLIHSYLIFRTKYLLVGPLALAWQVILKLKHSTDIS